MLIRLTISRDGGRCAYVYNHFRPLVYQFRISQKPNPRAVQKTLMVILLPVRYGSPHCFLSEESSTVEYRSAKHL